MGWWSERVLPHCVDRSLSTRPVMRLREQVCAGLSGRLLEVGFGSGLNVGAYPDAVTAVDAVEPSERAWALSAGRRAGSPVPVERTGLDGQRLEAPDATYDAALATFTLCTLPDPATALGEVRRVLRPGGTLHVLEHGLAPEPGVARWQRRLEPLQRRVAGGCHLTRDVPALLAAAGFRVTGVEQSYLPGPAASRPWGFTTRAVAVRA
ncbi:methyltransferase domain-containing protein [Nocardioides anomalus]|uniref:Methyltransferase domain-containing protein n=1 Tax=Nocardioides anomalus TaxID=2712223 RepID=A0A6G6WD99_9ACTN|nr:methyltransferase domain-containing protein [Nocardioides anomalus]QIG43204.1 methyltransferase domain-containing protein [Nocardioides anomalus]